MPIARLAKDSVFEPEDLTFLYEMLDQLCLLRGIERQSHEAEAAALALIARYKAGLRGDELAQSLELK
ncbi:MULTISPECIES: hypothetical protein [unclassified Mesorhizobium]|uniref:hypothetical protein n=1 Tax=unclassified Mesorhizobium TaxID=325217 RepID=UPI0011279162|nr:MULTISPECIES: hypothetical protein [unclassified Mesorhizobium]MBZ9722249.1 hypothetical protein [Mesorhizobium sp. AD1-1]TPN57319.1 hypothetical protein FJ978_01550 [Mesorhizobium sp. B1-1-7]TPN57735.1 hypothetical protein FJ976_03660 [Mesorhizobium sp. B1-1-9]